MLELHFLGYSMSKFSLDLETQGSLKNTEQNCVVNIGLYVLLMDYLFIYGINSWPQSVVQLMRVMY